MRVKHIINLLLPLALAGAQQAAYSTPASRLAESRAENVASLAKQASKLGAPDRLMKDGLVISKRARDGVIDYYYTEGRVSKIVGHRASWYIDVFYTPSGKLDHMVRSNGLIDTPIFNSEGVLVGLKSPTGKRISFTLLDRNLTQLSSTVKAGASERNAVDSSRHSRVLVGGDVNSPESPSSKDVNAKLIDGIAESDDMACQIVESGETECYEWPGGGGDDSGGGGGGGGIYNPPPGDESPPPGGGGDEGVGGGGGGSDLPPGVGHSDSPERAVCTAAAYRAYTIMIEYVCNKATTARNYANCMETAARLYADELTYCRTIP